MRTHSQRLLSMVLALSMLLTFLPVSAFADAGSTSAAGLQKLNNDNTYKDNDNNEYKYALNTDDNTATLTKFTGTTADVPKEVTQDGKTYYTVTTIGKEAFAKLLNGNPQYNTDLKSVILPGSIQTIEDYAFINCTELSSLTTRGQTTSIPNGITTINAGTFTYCEKLNDFNFPDSVTSIGLAAFSECHSFTKITLPNYLKTIEAWAFYQCERLDSVKIPVSVDTVGIWAFHDTTTATHTSKPFSEVYYTGTKTDWDNLVNSANFDNSNTQLTSALHFTFAAYSITPATPTTPPQQPGTTTPTTPPESTDKPTDKPNEPTTPEQPGTPEKPNEPATPEQPGTPEKPNEPTTPEQPGTPEKPNEPTTPEQPGTQDAPAVEEDDTAAIGYAAAAVTAAFVGWGAYRIGSEVYLKYLLPNDVLLPQNRIQLAELLWEDAGRPAPADAAAYADVDANDADAQQAARWAVENGLLTLPDTEKPDEFAPYRSVSYAKSARAWNQAQQLKENAAAR